MIEELTKEQMDKIPIYTDKWVKIGLNTDPCNFRKAVAGAKKAYKMAGLEEPKLFIGPVNNPVEASLAESLLKEYVGKTVSQNLNKTILKRIKEIIDSDQPLPQVNTDNQIYGNQEFILSFFDYFKNECGIDECKKLDGLIEIAENCGWWTALGSVCIFQHRPLWIKRDSQGRLHSLDSAAIKYRGSNRADIYAVHGVRVNSNIIEKKFTASDIENESNVEVRRVMIEIYGHEKFLLDSNSVLIHQDDFGKLYQKELPGDEPLMMVEVVNSTPEKDGTYKNYYIRVDPNAYGGLKTAMAAVASTWRHKDGSMVFKDPSEYILSMET